MRRIIVITGTPGSGKTTIAKRLHSSLKGSKLISANEVLSKKGLFSSISKDGAKVANMKALWRELSKEASSGHGDSIVEGHLLSEMRIKGATAFVIREHLGVLRGRLEERGYPVQKISDNLISEALDYCGAHAFSNYRRCFEVMSGRNAHLKILEILGTKAQNSTRIELLEELMPMFGGDPDSIVL